MGFWSAWKTQKAAAFGSVGHSKYNFFLKVSGSIQGAGFLLFIMVNNSLNTSRAKTNTCAARSAGEACKVYFYGFSLRLGGSARGVMCSILS
jgi:hypothetical protein